MSEQKQGIYEFHNFQLDIGKGVLLRENLPVTLQWKTFELLCTLVRSNGKLITRDELMNELWAETFVEDNNLSQHIRALRKALGDGENGAVFIETVPRRGYRFLPEVRIIETAKVDSNVETHNLFDTETVSDALTSEQRKILYPTPVAQDFVYENWKDDALFDTPQATSKSFSRFKPIAAAIVLTMLIAGFVAWNYRSNPNNPEHRRLLYATQINLAAQSWETSNLMLMKEQLDSSMPKSGEEDLRGFEWYYLSRLYAQNVSAQSLVLPHNNLIGEVAFSPDGKTLAIACWDNKTRLFNAVTGQQIATFNGHTDRVEAVAFSPDGKTLVTGSYDKTVKLWDAVTGQEHFSLKLDPEFGGIYFSADGRVVAAVDGKKTRFWEVATGREITDFFKSVKDNFLLLGFSSDGKTAAIRGDAVSVKLVEIATGRIFATVKGHTDLVVDARFSPDGKTFATGSWDGTAKIWEVSTGRELFTLKGHAGRLYDIAFSPDGKLLATGGTADQTVRLWNTATGAEFAALKGHEGEIATLSFSPDSRKLAAGNDKTARVWNVPQGEINDLLAGHTDLINAAVFSPDGKVLATASKDRAAKLWNAATGQEILTLKGHADSVNAAAFSPNGTILATGGDDKLIKFWHVATGRELLSVKSASDVSNITFSPDGKTIATSHWQNNPVVELWDAATGQQTGTFSGHTAGVWNIVFSPDGRQLATAGDDDTVRLWNVETRQEIPVFKGVTEANYGVAFSPDGQPLIVEGTNKDRNIRLLSITGEELIAFKGNTDEIISFAFSPDGKRLITGGWNENGRIWDVVTGQELFRFKASGVAFAPDGKTIAAVNDKTVRLLRASDRKE